MFIRLCYRHSRLADHIVRIVKIHLYIRINCSFTELDCQTTGKPAQAGRFNKSKILDILRNNSLLYNNRKMKRLNSLHCKTNMQSYTIPFKSMQMYLCFLSMLSTSFSHHQRNIQTHWHITNIPSHKQLLMLIS